MSSFDHPARYWHELSNGKYQCDLCPHLCKLSNGQRGVCYVRGRVDDKMLLHSYGRSSGFCIDPIEKKPLNHFLPGTPVLSFGTAGCNLTCKFCQNWDISKSRQMDSLASQATPEALAKACVQTGCRSIAYTYNDPVIFLEYAVDVAQACAELGIKSVAVSGAYINEAPRQEFFQHMDAANIDLKGFNQTFYQKLCGGHLQTVLDSLNYLVNETDVWVEITNLIIPGENDDPEELSAMCRWIVDTLGVDVPLHFTAFHPDFKMLDKARTPLSTLLAARDIARASGIRYVYTGNVGHVQTGSSYCHHCGELVIERQQYTLGKWSLDKQGKCQHCDTPFAGIFDAQPGDWGAKRQRLVFK